MTRREFSGSIAGLVVSSVFVSGQSSQVVILHAIAGARLPETLAITTNSPEEMRRGVWELRTYRSAQPALAQHLAGVFSRAGIRAELQNTDGGNLTYLIPFENLTARCQAWTAVNADPQWSGARVRFESYQFGLYRSA